MQYSTWIRMAVLCILGALSNGLYASDGVVVIDQSSVAVGNVTPGDAPGFPATLSVPGSYRLASNLILNQPNVSAIDITADNVALDLNGTASSGSVRTLSMLCHCAHRQVMEAVSKPSLTAQADLEA